MKIRKVFDGGRATFRDIPPVVMQLLNSRTFTSFTFVTKFGDNETNLSVTLVILEAMRIFSSGSLYEACIRFHLFIWKLTHSPVPKFDLRIIHDQIEK